MNKPNSITLRKHLSAPLVFVITLFGAAFFSSLAHASEFADWIEGEGVVQEISLSDSTVVITGFQYRVVPHANVEIRGNASSLAGLAVGMKVQFMYERFVGLKADVAAVEDGFVIHELRQLPDNVSIEES